MIALLISTFSPHIKHELLFQLSFKYHSLLIMLSRSSSFRVFYLAILLVSPLLAQDDDFLYDVFPSDFNWGFATASYQIEGGWNEDGIFFLLSESVGKLELESL
jgi:Gpi18-like mannosyltransferase